jgi:hypothetical protein
MIPQQEYFVKSSKGDTEYCVFNSWHKGFICTCRHFAIKQTECRHIKEVKENKK